MWCLVHTCTHWTCFFNLIDYDIDLTELMFWKWSLLLLHCWPIEYLRMSWQWGWSAIMAASSPCSAARKPRSALTLCQFAQILIDWTGSAILGHFVKAVQFIGTQQAGMQCGDRAYFVVLIRVPEPVSQSRSQQERGFGGIDNNYLPSSHFVPQHLSKLNRTPWIIHNIKCSIYTGPIDWLLLALFSLWNHEQITDTPSLMVLPDPLRFLFFKSICCKKRNSSTVVWELMSLA